MLTDALRGCISQLCACLGAWQGKMEPNQISLVSRPQCALAVWGEGFRAGCQGWDEAPGPALGDLQSRNMPAKMIFLNLIISQRRRWMQGQSCRYHSQHHHHQHLQMIPARTGCDYLRVCVCVCVCVWMFTREIKVKLMKPTFFSGLTNSSVWRKLHSVHI